MHATQSHPNPSAENLSDSVAPDHIKPAAGIPHCLGKQGYLELLLVSVFSTSLVLFTLGISEDLAYQIMPMLPDSMLGKVGHVEDHIAPPGWLRLGIATMLTLNFIALTLSARGMSNTTAVHHDLRRLTPADEPGRRVLRRRRWGYRMAKIGYLAILTCLFGWLHSHALARMEIVDALAEVSPDGFNLKEPVEHRLFAAKGPLAPIEIAEERASRLSEHGSVGMTLAHVLAWLLYVALLFSLTPAAPAGSRRSMSLHPSLSSKQSVLPQHVAVDQST